VLSRPTVLAVLVVGVGLSAFCEQAAMTWSRKLSAPIALKDGRNLRTLNDAAALILSLPDFRQRSDDWRRAVPCLVAAADSENALIKAQAMLTLALKGEGLI
jgi:hypothetical protein